MLPEVVMRGSVVDSEDTPTHFCPEAIKVLRRKQSISILSLPEYILVIRVGVVYI